MDKRVVITGVGTINPLGHGEEFWDNLTNGRSGTGLVTKFDTTDHLCQLGAEIHPDYEAFGFTTKEVKKIDSFSLYAMIASQLAIKDSGLEIGDRTRSTGVIIGTGICGIESIQKEDEKIFTGKPPSRISPFLVPQSMPNAPCGQVSIAHGFQGPSFSVNSACASGSNAIISAAQTIKDGMANIVVTGGTEAPFVKSAYASFAKMKAMSKGYENDPKRASRPFDRMRSGFVMGEGAGIIILESLEHAKQRGAKIYAELIGYGATSDAKHITSPNEDGEGMRGAMAKALMRAYTNPEDVSYINAHGTSTELNDKTETLAIKRLFQDAAYKVPISSTKSMTGHLLGGAGGLEAVISALAIDRGVIPPTINYENPDPECDLDYTPNEAREANLKIVMSNSFGFGGHNVSLVLEKYKE